MMGASVFVRASSAFMSQVELGVGSAERVSRRGLSRHSIREVEAAIEDVRTQRFAAERERDLAVRERAAQLAAAMEWGEKAAYALSKERSDLAEQAISRQLDAERDAQNASDREQASTTEVERLAALTSELTAERKRMAAELAALQQPGRDAISGEHRTGAAEQRVERARARFDQLMDDERSGRSKDDSNTSAQEIDALRRADQVAERMATLRTGASEGSRKQRPAKRR
jgi:phage shock protein A